MQRTTEIFFRTRREIWYSGTPPYDYPVYTTNSLLRPYSFNPLYLRTGDILLIFIVVCMIRCNSMCIILLLLFIYSLA